ncbi:MAG: polyhydroxybutyrate depolymerase [Pseudomonadota bacterium]
MAKVEAAHSLGPLSPVAALFKREGRAARRQAIADPWQVPPFPACCTSYVSAEAEQEDPMSKTGLAATVLLLAGLLGFSLATPAMASDCGAADTPCSVPLGSYHIAIPKDGGRGAPIHLHLHGAGADGKAVINGGMTADTLGRGYAMIAPTGYQEIARWKKNWAVFDGRTYPRDDIAFLTQVIEDAVARHGLDRDRLLLSGFSRGGSFVWDVACRAPGMARAYAPVAGAFWDPLPEDCAEPVDLFHTHGWTDRVVPLEGRSFREGAVVQGDAFASLFILRATNGCAARQPESAPIKGDRWWRHWSDCRAGRIDLMLHPGGHGVPKGWTDLALDWFEERLTTEEKKACVASC